MLDVVVNNMAFEGGPSHVDYGSIQPLNKQQNGLDAFLNFPVYTQVKSSSLHSSNGF
jgi:hypothetical protein